MNRKNVRKSMERFEEIIEEVAKLRNEAMTILLSNVTTTSPAWNDARNWENNLWTAIKQMEDTTLNSLSEMVEKEDQESERKQEIARDLDGQDGTVECNRCLTTISGRNVGQMLYDHNWIRVKGTNNWYCSEGCLDLDKKNLSNPRKWLKS